MQDTSAQLFSPHEQHFRGHSCRPWSPCEGKVGRRENFVWERFSLILSAKRNSRKALELFGSAPNIYFLSRAPRPTRMVSWLFVWVRTIGLYCLATEVHLPWRPNNGIWQSYGFILRLLRRNMYNFMCSSNTYRVPYPGIPSTIKQLRLSVPTPPMPPLQPTRHNKCRCEVCFIKIKGDTYYAF